MEQIHLLKKVLNGMNRNRRPLGRENRKPVLEPLGKHLFYAEGSKTEPLYAKNIITVIKSKYDDRGSNLELKVIPHKGYNTLDLVKFAEEDVHFRIKNKERIDHVWIFYDKDSFPEDKFDNAHHKIISKNTIYNKENGEYTDKNGISWHSIWSNECFELWVLLHFDYIDAALNRGSYYTKIEERLGDGVYKKNLNNLYDLLIQHGDVNLAINSAKKLEKDNNINNPSTGVYKFVEHFKLYLGI